MILANNPEKGGYGHEQSRSIAIPGKVAQGSFGTGRQEVLYRRPDEIGPRAGRGGSFRNGHRRGLSQIGHGSGRKGKAAVKSNGFAIHIFTRAHRMVGSFLFKRKL